MEQVEIYTRDYCGYCTMAKRILDQNNVKYTEYNASKTPAMRDEMIQRSKRRTFPQVFIGALHVGGADDLAAFTRAGKLQPALAGELT